MNAPTLDYEVADPPHLQRRFGLIHAIALNMSNMVGIGPFITIGNLMAALGGPQSMIGWVIALVIAIPDGMIWSELGASIPGSGGSYLFLREAFGRESLGRFMAFLFIWQFILSGPLEIASGCIGFSNYLAYLWPGITTLQVKLVAAAVGVFATALLYRRITAVGIITLILWIATILTMAIVVIAGAMHFDRKLAFNFPPGAFRFTWGFVLGAAAASRIGMYDYLGYYDICHIGDEVKDPGRVIPRSILISLLVVAVFYFGINLSLIGVVPWQELKPDAPVASLFMEKLYHGKVAGAFTVMVLITAVASVFALLLGYSRVPYAAARNGDFFRVFAALHPTKNFPHVSLLVIGGISVACSFLSLDMVINALLTTRILVPFISQIAAVTLLRRRRPDMERPYRIWLYPIPSFIALVGWLFLFVTADWQLIAIGLGTLLLGAIVFLIWSKTAGRWPFEGTSGEETADCKSGG